MTKFKAVLFDVDGVLVLPPRMFSEIYCEKYGKDLESLESFYKSEEFQNALVGKLDLKDAIKAHQDKWQWEGNLDELINEWLEGENYPNYVLLAFVDELRVNGTKVYIVTAQEKYRAAYLCEKVFAEMFDGYLVTSEIGLHKHTVMFWEEVIKLVNLEPADIAYFDDKPNLVILAKSLGIKAYVYKDVETVRQIVNS